VIACGAVPSGDPDGGCLHALPHALRGADAAYKKAVLGATRARVAVEAAVEMGWECYISLEGRFIGMHDFGRLRQNRRVYKKFDNGRQGGGACRARRRRRLPPYDIVRATKILMPRVVVVAAGPDPL
jgi:hypothetical protein